MLLSTSKERREYNGLKTLAQVEGGEKACPGRMSVDRAREPVPCLSPTLQFLQVSPSDSTLKREFSLDAVAMTTLLTKTSFCGGGWLTQKPRVLGKGVHSDECICRAILPLPPPGSPRSS